MERIKKWISALFLLLIFFSLTPDTAALADATAPIRVGWFARAGYMEKSGDGGYSGYNYEYLKAIARETGWRYEFVDGTPIELIEQLKRGEIDLLGCLFYTSERAEAVAFSDYSAGTDCLSLFTRNDSSFAANDEKALEGLCIGVTSEAAQAGLDAFARKSGFTYTAKQYACPEKLHRALDRHEIDAGIYGGFQPRENTRVLVRFAPAPFYFATSKENRQVLSQLNGAMERILMENPYYSKDLTQKYLSTDKTSFGMTPREKELIRTLPPITVAYQSNWAPLEAKNEDGQFSGVIAGVYQKVSQLTGISFEFVPMTAYRTIETDMIASFEQNFVAASAMGMSLTDSYITIPMVLVRKEGAAAPNKKTAVTAKKYCSEEMTRQGYHFVTYETAEDCIAAVKNEEVEQAFVDSVVANNLLRRARYKGLTRVALPNQRLDLCAAVSDELDPMVYHVINKAVKYIVGSEVNDLLIDSTFQKSTITFEKVVEQMPTDVIIIFSLFAFCAFLGVSVAFLICIRAAKKVKNALYYDNLTGVLTKYGFEKTAREILNKSDKNFFVLDFDVYKFRDFNSLQGHRAGDELLCSIAKETIQSFSSKGLCARIYADHFVCLVQRKQVEDVVKKITEDRRISSNADNMLLISFKYGIYEIKDRSLPVSQMMDCAYAAKQRIDPKSNDFYCIYDDGFYQRQLADAALLLDADNAFQNKEFVVFFQPKFDAETEKIVAAEALVRWQRADGEMIFPDRFIELFEKNGKIRALDFYMLRETCAYQRELIDSKLPCVPISVNFSGVHFYDVDFAGRINRVVHEYGLERHLIEVEFTETEMIENIANAEKVLTELQSLGFSIAMDDFGSGYSSLNSLKDLPIDIVKLDRGFFSERTHRENAKLIVDSVIRLAARMKLKTVAEGIETKEQLEFVRSCGCDMIQGYYFSRPVDGSVFCAMLVNLAEREEQNAIRPS